MGYRSKVRIVTTKEGYDLMRDFVDAHTEEGEPRLIGRDVEPEIFDEHLGSVVFGWNDVNWYVEVREVRCVEDALLRLCDECIPYCKVRVGADWDDIEVDGENCDLPIGVYPVTGIEIVKWED